MTELQGPVWRCQACYWLRTTGLAWYSGHAREGPRLVGQDLVSLPVTEPVQRDVYVPDDSADL